MRALAALLLLALAAPAQAAGLTGRELLQQCEAARAACLRVLREAVAQNERIIAEGREAAWFCPPEGGDPPELRRHFVEWAHENADALDGEAMAAVKAALQESWSCTE